MAVEKRVGVTAASQEAVTKLESEVYLALTRVMNPIVSEWLLKKN